MNAPTKVPRPGDWTVSWSLAGCWLVYLEQGERAKPAILLAPERELHARLIAAAPGLLTQAVRSGAEVTMLGMRLMGLAHAATARGEGELARSLSSIALALSAESGALVGAAAVATISTGHSEHTLSTPTGGTPS